MGATKRRTGSRRRTSRRLGHQKGTKAAPNENLRRRKPSKKAVPIIDKRSKSKRKVSSQKDRSPSVKKTERSVGVSKNHVQAKTVTESVGITGKSQRKAKLNARKMISKATKNLNTKLESDHVLIKQEKEQIEIRERMKKENEFFKKLTG